VSKKYKNKPNPWLETDPTKWTGNTLNYYTLVGEYFKRFRNEVFVETGSLVGNGLWCALQAGFSKLYSIEIHEHLFNQVKERFNDEYRRGQLILIHGNSELALPEVVASLTAPATFWLDAHISSNYGEQLAKNCPIFEELETIHKSPVKTHTLLIDDVACFNHEAHDNIPLEAVKQRILKINPAYVFEQLDAVLPGNILAAWVPKD
jgi:hypothetical protein